MFKVNSKYTDAVLGVFIVNFEHILQLFLVFLLSTLNRYPFAGISRNPCNDSEAYSNPCQTSKIDRFANIVKC